MPNSLTSMKIDTDMSDDPGYESYMENLQIWVKTALEDWDIKLLSSAVITFFVDIFGEDWWIIQCLFIMLFTDFFFGIVCAIKFDGRLSNTKLHNGVLKFLAYAISIILVWVVQEIVFRTLPINLPIMGVYAGYQTLTEIKSVARHLERLGITMPTLFHKVTHGTEEKIEQQINDALSENQDPERKEKSE